MNRSSLAVQNSYRNVPDTKIWINFIIHIILESSISLSFTAYQKTASKINASSKALYKLISTITITYFKMHYSPIKGSKKRLFAVEILSLRDVFREERKFGIF